MKKEFINKPYAILAAVCLCFYALFFAFSAFTLGVSGPNSLGLAPIFFVIMVIHILSSVAYGTVSFAKLGKIIAPFGILVVSYAFGALVFFLLFGLNPNDTVEVLNLIGIFACFVPLALASALIAKLIRWLWISAQKRWPNLAEISVSKAQKLYFISLLSIFLLVQVALAIQLSPTIAMCLGSAMRFNYVYLFVPGLAAIYGIIMSSKAKNLLYPSIFLLGAYSLFATAGVVIFCIMRQDIPSILFYMREHLLYAPVLGIISFVATLVTRLVAKLKKKE